MSDKPAPAPPPEPDPAPEPHTAVDESQRPPDPRRGKASLGDPVLFRRRLFGLVTDLRGEARPTFANDAVWLELDRLMDDALAAKHDPTRLAQPGEGPDPVNRIVDNVRTAQAQLMQPRHFRPWARRRARLHARDVVRRSREELYLYLSEARVRALLPRLRQDVETSLNNDYRRQAYVALLDRLMQAPAAQDKGRPAGATQ